MWAAEAGASIVEVSGPFAVAARVERSGRVPLGGRLGVAGVGGDAHELVDGNWIRDTIRYP
jgi:hypothetical protein